MEVLTSSAEGCIDAMSMVIPFAPARNCSVVQYIVI
jgi:hypothetical protein